MTRTRALMLLRRKLLMSQKMLTKRPSGDCKPSFSLFCSALLLPVEWTPQSLQDYLITALCA